MCARFNLKSNPTELAEIFELLREPDWAARFNIAPTQQVLVIRQWDNGGRTGDQLRWGLVPHWADDLAIGSKMIMARSESVATKSAFKEAFHKRRCLIPATGFYEWQPVTKLITQPWHIHHQSGEMLTFAGIWETWKDDAGTDVETCAIVTTRANSFMAEIHERMPVILPSESRGTWLDPTVVDSHKLQELLVPFRNDTLIREPVSTIINNPKNDSEACIKPVKLSRGLFD